MLCLFGALIMYVALSLPYNQTNCILNFDHVDSLQREEAEDLIKQHGDRVIGSISKKTIIHTSILLFLGFILVGIWWKWCLFVELSLMWWVYREPKNLGRLSIRVFLFEFLIAFIILFLFLHAIRPFLPSMDCLMWSPP